MKNTVKLEQFVALKEKTCRRFEVGKLEKQLIVYLISSKEDKGVE